MSESGRYIYGVIPSTTNCASTGFLQTDKSADDAIIGQSGLNIVVHEDIAAIVAPAMAIDMATLQKDALAKALLAHQQVVELAMQDGAIVIPFRLGTWVPSESDAMDVLVKGKELIRRIFDEIHDKIELDVAAVWSDFDAILQEVGEEDAIRKCRAALTANPKGVSVDDRMKIGAMVKESLDRKRLETGRWIVEKLKGVSCAQSLHENMNDRMISNVAFLVETKHRAEFERSLDDLDKRFAGKLNFRCVGPLAPYSFYTLELKRIEWEEVDRARRVMGLGDAASAEDIKKAFQHSAHAKHPDHCPQNGEAVRDFDELNSARRTLLEYAQACGQTEKTAQIVFAEENVKRNSLLVRKRET
jgi:hypothetical protein